MEAQALISRIFGGLDAEEYKIEVRPVPGHFSLVEPGVPEIPEDISDTSQKVNWFFGVVPRLASDSSRAPVATVVWCDVEREVPLNIVHPAPSIAVASGKGTHIYWRLTEPAPVDRVVRLTKLAAVALDADFSVCEPARIMRLPGSFNMKYDPPRPVHILHNTEKAYELEDLEEDLVAAMVLTVWDEGNHHPLALGLGSLLYRAGWSEDRAVRVIRTICRIGGTGDAGDKVEAVRGTYLRAATQAVSTAPLREALKDMWKRVVDGLGFADREGDVIQEGEAIARKETLEHDLITIVLAQEEWAYTEGRLVRWDGRVWRSAENEELGASIFELAAGLRVINKFGDSVPLALSTRMAMGVATMVRGNLQAKPLDPPLGHLLAMENGVLNLETLEVEEVRKDHNFRWLVPIRYDEEAECPLWEQFLAEAAPAEAALLQEWMGYLLKDGNPWQRMLWLYGPTGTGKSTFLRVVKALLGPARVAISAEGLSDYSVAALSQARAGVCSEISSKVLKTTTLKALVAGDDITGRHPYGRPFTVVFTGKMVWASNALPPVDQGEGVWRRLHVVPFMNVPSQVNHFLANALELELSGILNWALEGLRRVKEYAEVGDWPVPESVNATVAEYRESADLFNQFASDELDMEDPESTAPVMDLYARYKAWAVDRGYHPIPYGPNFYRELRNVGLVPSEQKMVNRRRVRMWRGGKLQEEVFAR